jgi:hypothetical protein
MKASSKMLPSLLLEFHVKRSIQKYKMLMWRSVPVSTFLSRKYLKNYVRSEDYRLLGYDVMSGKEFSTSPRKLLRPGWKNLHLQDGVTRVSSQPLP